MKTDMSPQAVSRRLKKTSELRRLCLALQKRGPGTGGSGAGSEKAERTGGEEKGSP